MAERMNGRHDGERELTEYDVIQGLTVDSFAAMAPHHGLPPQTYQMLMRDRTGSTSSVGSESIPDSPGLSPPESPTVFSVPQQYSYMQQAQMQQMQQQYMHSQSLQHQAAMMAAQQQYSQHQQLQQHHQQQQQPQQMTPQEIWPTNFNLADVFALANLGSPPSPATKEEEEALRLSAGARKGNVRRSSSLTCPPSSASVHDPAAAGELQDESEESKRRRCKPKRLVEELDLSVSVDDLAGRTRSASPKSRTPRGLARVASGSLMRSPRNSPRSSPRPSPRSSFLKPQPAPSDQDSILVIVEQPAQFGRFRYEAEGRQNCLEGRSSDTFPTVAVNPKYAASIPDGTLVRVSLVKRYDDEQGNPVPHWHMLTSKDNGDTSQPLRNGRAEFPNLVVKRQKSSVRHSSEDQRAIRLKFSISVCAGSVPREVHVISAPVFNADLKIDRLSHQYGYANEPTTVILLCTKVQKKTIALRISTDPSSDYMPPGGGWHQDPQCGGLVAVLRSDELETHHQYAVIADIPAFVDPFTKEPQVVYLQLIDEADETSSEPMQFRYIPSRNLDNSIV